MCQPGLKAREQLPQNIPRPVGPKLVPEAWHTKLFRPFRACGCCRSNPGRCPGLSHLGLSARPSPSQDRSSQKKISGWAPYNKFVEPLAPRDGLDFVVILMICLTGFAASLFQSGAWSGRPAHPFAAIRKPDCPQPAPICSRDSSGQTALPSPIR